MEKNREYFVFNANLTFVSIMISDTFGPDKCCFKFFAQRLPKNKVTSYKYTDRLCSMEGVL